MIKIGRANGRRHVILGWSKLAVFWYWPRASDFRHSPLVINFKFLRSLWTVMIERRS